MTPSSIPDCGLHNAAVAKIGGAATDAQSVWQPEVPADWRFLGQITGEIEIPAAHPSCGSLRGQPCRPYVALENQPG